MVGLRGVGKTVLLDRIRQHAEAEGNFTLWIEHVENLSLPSKLVPQLRIALLRLSSRSRAKDRTRRAFSALAGFANSLKIKLQDIELGFDFPLESGLADCGDLESDLTDLLEIVARAAKAEGVEIREDALALVVEQTRCYPYFLQEWGKHIWDEAECSPITKSHVEAASILAIAELGACADPRPTDLQRDAVEPRPRRYRVHSPFVRPIHVAQLNMMASCCATQHDRGGMKARRLRFGWWGNQRSSLCSWLSSMVKPSGSCKVLTMTSITPSPS